MTTLSRGFIRFFTGGFIRGGNPHWTRFGIRNIPLILGGGQKYGRLYVVLGGICWDGLVYGVGVERVRQRLVEKVRDGFIVVPMSRTKKGKRRV